MCNNNAEMATKAAQILNTRDELNELVRRRAELAVCYCYKDYHLSSGIVHFPPFINGKTEKLDFFPDFLSELFSKWRNIVLPVLKIEHKLKCKGGLSQFFKDMVSNI